MAGIFLVGWNVLVVAQVIPFFNPFIMMGRSLEVIPEYYIGPAIIALVVACLTEIIRHARAAMNALQDPSDQSFMVLLPGKGAGPG